MADRVPEHGGPDVDPEGAAKLLVTAQALLLRRQRPELFAGYRPVPAEGPAAHHAIAFARSPQLVAVATRLPVRLAERGGWADTVLPLPDGVATWTDVLTGTPTDGSAPPLAQVLARYLSYLERQSPLDQLTPRQLEILKLIAQSKSNKQMATVLGIGAKNVEAHRAQLMDRLGIHDVAGLVRLAIRFGLVSPDS